ncbi:MAG: tRNA pseudouridine(38-40) synthase TruA [Actinomycetota bacterium]
MPRPPRPETAPPPAGMTRYAALVAYDGAAFHGFAANPGVETVAGAIDDALSRVLSVPVRTACAGRTDAGVHAWGQVVSFDGPPIEDPGRLEHSLNRMLAPSIVVRDLSAVTDDFDARFSAESRTYRYRLLNREQGDPFHHHLVWHVAGPLDLEAMRTAASHLVGEHDFSSFCRRRMVLVDGVEVAADLTREIHAIGIEGVQGDLVDLWLTANAFCHQMVRAITGTLVEVGSGKRDAASIPATIAARDRHAAGALAPPQGLTLWAVDYG